MVQILSLLWNGFYWKYFYAHFLIAKFSNYLLSKFKTGVGVLTNNCVSVDDVLDAEPGFAAEVEVDAHLLDLHEFLAAPGHVASVQRDDGGDVVCKPQIIHENSLSLSGQRFKVESH